MREKKLQEIEKVAETIRLLALPGMKPKALIEAVKARHPDASKKDRARRIPQRHSLRRILPGRHAGAARPSRGHPRRG